MNRMHTKQLALLIGLVSVLALSLAACGKGGGSSSSSGGGEAEGTVSASDLARYEKELAAAYKGTNATPTGEPISPKPGANIWLIPYSSSTEVAGAWTKSIEEVGEKFGWEVHVVNGKFESSQQLTGIQEAIADKADGILLYAVDCAPVKSGLEQAKKAGIPVVGLESTDCEPPLETYSIPFGHEDFLTWEAESWAGDQARWIIGETKGLAKTIVTEETDLSVTRDAFKGVEKRFKACPTCEILEVVKFVGSEFGPALQAKIEQALNKYPEANSFLGAYDAVMTGGGGAAAIRASGRSSEIKSMGGEGSIPGIELIYNEAGMDACAGIDYEWVGYASIMSMARIIEGQDPSKEDNGLGVQVCDKTHNLPPKGESYKAAVDYRAAYEKMWNLP